MPSDEENLKTIKAEIRSLIVSSPVGLTIEKFLGDYKACIGSTLPFNDFGHKNAQDFLNSMPDVVQLKKAANGMLLVPVQNKLVSHINDLVSKQRNTRKKKTTLKPRMTRVDNRRYYQVVTCKKNKNRRPRKLCNIRPEAQRSLDSLVSIDDIDNLHFDWITDYPKKHFSNIMSYGQTKEFSPPRRPSSISIHRDKLSETIRSPQTTSCKEYDYHENSEECTTSEFYGLKKTNCCTPENLPSSDSESGLESDHFSLGYKSECNSTGESDDNESSLSNFGKYGQTLHRPIRRSSFSEKEYMEPSFQLQPKSSRFSETTIKLKEDNQKSSKSTNREIGNDIYVSKEHEIYLTALAHGIVLDPSKVIDPYKHLLSLVQSPKISNDADINLTQSPKVRDINSSSTSLKECELNIGSDVEEKYAANNDVIKINKLISHFRKMFNDKHHCSNENMENGSILRNDSSEALNKCNVNEKSSHESICDRNYFHPENEISEENTVRKDLTGIERGLFLEQCLQSKEKRLGCTNEKISPYCNSLSFGRGLALKNMLGLYQEGKSKALGDVSSRTTSQGGGIGRGLFLKIMQKKYFQVPN